MTRHDEVPEPCTQEAREQGCTCGMSRVYRAYIDPPEPEIDKYCPLHGCAQDPDEERERRRDDKEFWK
jgi:hypothetical protein